MIELKTASEVDACEPSPQVSPRRSPARLCSRMVDPRSDTAPRTDRLRWMSRAAGSIVYNWVMPVTALHRYPVKSMLGESLTSCRIDEHGLAGDRCHALIDVESGTVASAKVPRWWGGLLGFSARCVTEPVPGEAPPVVAITFPDGSVHRSDDTDIDTALSDALGRRVRLSASPPPQAAFEEVWPEIEGLAPESVITDTRVRDEETGEPVSRFDIAAMAPGSAFVDIAALHLLTGATLARLRELAPGATFDERRCRPNIVLDACGAEFVENGWPGRAIAFPSGATATVTIPTMRCVMTTLAQDGLPRDADVLRTVAAHNRIDIPGMGRWACAGAYADVATAGEVTVGDAYEVR